MASAAIKSPGAPKVLPQPPDLTFSRPNVQITVLGHGSQSTVVLMEVKVEDLSIHLATINKSRSVSERRRFRGRGEKSRRVLQDGNRSSSSSASEFGFTKLTLFTEQQYLLDECSTTFFIVPYPPRSVIIDCSEIHVLSNSSSVS